MSKSLKRKTRGRKRKMNNEDGSQQNRKRVKKAEENKEMKIISKAFTEEAKENLKTYVRLKTIYEDEGMTQRTHQFLIRITKKKLDENKELNKYPLMQYLTNACKILMLNEYEICHWAVWLDEHELDSHSDFSVEDFVFNTAFCVKLSLNNEKYLGKIHPWLRQDGKCLLVVLVYQNLIFHTF
ncbi:unnamed protein product [Moneuplotes crassus]|uniref:Uncharacterized protein n=1 Tax=Euplotes crassus TaxID=5936 RepID=A0AAD1Y6E3_EUPCR|nr:unnamed protein product [Moneuplotes crassus]